MVPSQVLDSNGGQSQRTSAGVFQYSFQTHGYTHQMPDGVRSKLGAQNRALGAPQGSYEAPKGYFL